MGEGRGWVTGGIEGIEALERDFFIVQFLSRV